MQIEIGKSYQTRNKRAMTVIDTNFRDGKSSLFEAYPILCKGLNIHGELTIYHYNEKGQSNLCEDLNLLLEE